jgi:hypothetical protein
MSLWASINDIAQLITDSALGTSIRESVYAYPIIEGLHLIGLTFSVGLILFVDLRLLGVFLRNVPVTDILRPLRPWLLTGFALTFITGALLFTSNAAKFINLWIFPLKILFIALAGVNALWFESLWGAKADQWQAFALPKPVRFAALTSITLWSAVIVAGRLIPYLSYK